MTVFMWFWYWFTTPFALIPRVVMCRGKANFVVNGEVEVENRVVRVQKSPMADILAWILLKRSNEMSFVSSVEERLSSYSYDA